MKIGPGVSELWRVENRPLPLTKPMAYKTSCTTVQAVIRHYCLDPCSRCNIQHRLGHAKMFMMTMIMIYVNDWSGSRSRCRVRYWLINQWP